jgi:hypothetical protein
MQGFYRRAPLKTLLAGPRRLKWSSAGCRAILATDPIERVVVVMEDGAAREAPLAAVLFDQLALVAAGRKATVAAVL